MMEADRVHNTVAWLKLCQRARREGYKVCQTTDPAWLVNTAINRRAGEIEDPGSGRMTGRANHRGGFPRKLGGDYQRHLWLAAQEINTPRLIVRPQSLGELREELVGRIPGRFTYPEDE